MWLSFAFIGYFLLAITFVLDKFILTKSVANPLVYTFYSTVFLILAFLLAPFGLEMLGGTDLLVALVSG